MQTKIKLLPLVAAMGCVYATSSIANDTLRSSSGSLNVLPSISTSISHDDNIRANNTKESSRILTINPNFLLTGETAKTFSAFELDINQRKYSHSSDYDLLDLTLEANTELYVNVRNQLNFSASHTSTESIDNLLDTTNEVERFDTNQIGAEYLFGAPGAMFNLEAGINGIHFRSAERGQNLDLERDTINLNTSLLTRISPRTQIELELRSSEVDYKQSAASVKNSETLTYLVGLRWEATAMTTGRIKIGQQNRKFTDNPAKSSESSSTWELGIVWEPLTYSNLTLTGGQKYDEGSFGYNYAETTRVNLAWNHEWRHNLSSTLNLGMTEEAFKDGSTPDRTDKSYSAGINMDYKIRYWLDIQAGYSYSERDSVAATRDFDRNQVRLGVKVSFL